MLRSDGPGCTTPQQWQQLLRRSGCCHCCGPATAVGTAERPARLIAPADGAISPVCLVLPRGGAAQPLLRHTLEQLRLQPALAK